MILNYIEITIYISVATMCIRVCSSRMHKEEADCARATQLHASGPCSTYLSLSFFISRQFDQETYTLFLLLSPPPKKSPQLS